MMGESHGESPLGAASMSPMTAAKPCSTPSEHSINMMVILAAIVCACLCALGLNTMLQCVFQCAMEPFQWIASRRLNSGLKKREVVALPTSTYTHSGGSPSNCAICLSEFCDGEKIRFLPNCNHRFHVHCIDKWLLSHSSCPTCRNFLKPTPSLPCSSIIVSFV